MLRRLGTHARVGGARHDHRVGGDGRQREPARSRRRAAPREGSFGRALERFPELADYKITHAWQGNVALTIDEEPHLGKLDGLHYALGCNGSGVAQMTYMGTQLARKIARVANYRCAFDSGSFPTHPLYHGNKGLLVPLVGNYLRVRDWWDRKMG